MNNKKLFGLIILVVLLVAIPLTLYLVKQRQNLRPKASNVNESRVEIWQNGSQLDTTMPTVTDPNVQLKIYYVPSPLP